MVACFPVCFRAESLNSWPMANAINPRATSLISEREYNTWATEDLITRLYNGSARDLVAALVHSDGLTKEDLEELQHMFRVEE